LGLLDREDGLERVPREVKRFIAGNVDSVGQLEVLLLVRSDPERYWSAAEVSRALRSGRGWAEVQLEYLRVEGLLASGEGNDPRYRYDPARPEFEPVIDRVSEAFASQRAEVIRLVFSQRPSERLRVFSEAFRLRKPQ
jgi:hypothetical protein